MKRRLDPLWFAVWFSVAVSGVFLVGVGLLGSTVQASPSLRSEVAQFVAGGLPASQFNLSLRQNGPPVYLGHTSPRSDGGTIGSVDGGAGNLVMTECYAGACLCAGVTCSCVNAAGALVAIGSASTGRFMPANTPTTMVMGITSLSSGMVTVAAGVGSVLFDGGPGAECDHWGL